MTDTTAAPPAHPNGRQVLCAIGNRYVVFGSGSGLRDAPRFGPGHVANRLPRVGDDRELVEERIVQSLVVEGFEVRHVEGLDFGDVELVGEGGRSILVEIKAGDRDFAGVDLAQAWKDLAQADQAREIWGFNLERLSLGMVWSNHGSGPGFVELLALDVWEFDRDGSVYDRRQVMASVDEWCRRVDGLFAEVDAWAREDGLTVMRDRTIPMSEELMQKFAVPDREMQILDLLDCERPVVSMKPEGLWFIGFDGMIDIITRQGTYRLVGLREGRDLQGSPVWTLIDFKGNTRRTWDRDAFRSVLGRVPAGE